MTGAAGEHESASWSVTLRRRKVVQWGLVYVAGAWGFLQGLQYLSATYDWPRQIQQLTTLALLIGLPIVLVLAALRAQIEHWGDSGPYFVALSYAQRGDRDRAIQWLERAYTRRDPSLVEMFGNPFLDNVADDSRFIAFLRKMKLPGWPRPTKPTGLAATGK
jgi:hypothetical protein